jgi:hypothetical protein
MQCQWSCWCSSHSESLESNRNSAASVALLIVLPRLARGRCAGADRRLADGVELGQREDVAGLDVSLEDRTHPGVKVRENEAVHRLQPPPTTTVSI